MINLADPGSPEAVTPDDFVSLMIDRRAFHAPSVIVDGKRKSYEPDERPWSLTTGITYHQTACNLGERIERYDTLGAHFGIPRSGRIIRLCANNRIVYHGNGWNNRCVGIEVDGLFAGRENDPNTALDESLRSTWDDPSTPTRELPTKPTEAQLRSLRMLTRWICYDVMMHGGNVKFLVAHRQSSLDRQNDPGELVWKGAALPLHAELGLEDGGVGFKIGGYAIPECWDPRCKGIPY